MTFLPLLYCSDKTDMAIRLFMALRLEDQSLRLTIQEAATSLATAYKVTLESMLLSSFLQSVLHKDDFKL